MKTRKYYLLAIGLVFGSLSGFAQANIEITVKNISEQKGTIRVGLFSNENDFLKKITEGKVVKASAAEVKVIFENVKPGEYGLSVFHDKNENGELDTNSIGIPKEGFAFGNNASGMFGPPSFEKAKVVVDKTPVKQVIELKYF